MLTIKFGGKGEQQGQGRGKGEGGPAQLPPHTRVHRVGYKLRVIDVDVKHGHKVPHYFTLDQEILRHYTATTHQLRISTASLSSVGSHHQGLKERCEN